MAIDLKISRKYIIDSLPCLGFILVVEVISEFGSGGNEYGNWVHSDSFVEVLFCCPGVSRTLTLKQNACQKGENAVFTRKTLIQNTQ